MSTVVLSPEFHFHYQLTDDEKLRSSRNQIPSEVLEKEEKLIQRLKEMRHPLDLNSIFVTPEGMRPSDTTWRIWKGSLSKRRSGAGGATRFILQLQRVSENDLTVIAHYRSDNHDEYERMLKRLKDGDLKPVTPRPLSVQNNKADHTTTRWVHMPGDLLPPLTKPYITESAAIPPTLQRHQVLQAMESGDVTFVDTPDGSVKITKMPNGCWNISADEIDDRPRRAYQIQALNDQNAWNLLREIAERPEIDPCLILSNREEEFLSSFQEKGKLPALVDGSAGSGKTTLLSMSLAAVVDGARTFSAPDPLFVTYSPYLRDLARKRLISALIIQRGWQRDSAEQTAQKVCRTFSEVVDEILNNRVDAESDNHRAANLAGEEWKEFLKWWNKGERQRAFVRGGESPIEHFRVLRTFFFGYLPVDRSPSSDDLEDLQERRRSRAHLYDVSEMDLESSLRIWNEYRVHLPKTGTVADRSNMALEICLSDPRKYCTWGHIIVDEIQDFSDHDIRFIISLSRFSTVATASLIKAETQNYFDVSLPLFMAGDEMQSINPSGFTFAGCHELLQDTVSAMGFELTAPPTRVRMTDNFRNLQRIADLTVSCQRLLTRLDRAKSVIEPHLHRLHEGEGVVEQISVERPLHPSVVAALSSTNWIVVLPCRWEEKERFVSESLTDILGEHINLDYKNFFTVEGCKGLEYPTIVLCGFASAYSRDQLEGRSRWILNALIVAVSRARNRVVLLDQPNAPRDLFNDLRDVGYRLEWITEASHLESTDTEQAEILCSRFKNLAEDPDDVKRSKSDVEAQLKSLLSNLQEIIDRNQLTRQKASQCIRTMDACSAWQEFLTSGTVTNWSALRKFPGGRLWERIIDEAIAMRSARALENLFPVSDLRGFDVEPRLFQAACVLAVDSTQKNSVSDRIIRLIEHLNMFPSAGDPNWISSLISKSPAIAEIFSDVHRTIKSTSSGWDRPEVMSSAEQLELIDPADWTAGLLRVKHLMSNTAQARTELRHWKPRLPDQEYAELELEILLVGYGLNWIDDTTARQELLREFQITDSPDRDIFKCMKLPSVQKCAERQLDYLYSVIQQRTTPPSPVNERSPAFIMSAINNIVQKEAEKSIRTLSLTRATIQTALNPKEV